MLLNVEQIVSTIAAAMDDPAQSRFDKDYCLPFINLAWNDLSVKLAALGLNEEEVVVVLADLPAGTKDLDPYQQTNGELQSMMVPLVLEWKRTTEDDTKYKEVPKDIELIDVDANQEGIAGYEWRAGSVKLAPSSIDVDLRIRFKAYSVQFTDPSQNVSIGAGNILAYKACELLCAPTVGNNQQGALYFNAKAAEAIDDFESLAVKLKQRELIRFGRMSGRARRLPRVIVRASDV